MEKLSDKNLLDKEKEPLPLYPLSIKSNKYINIVYNNKNCVIGVDFDDGRKIKRIFNKLGIWYIEYEVN